VLDELLKEELALKLYLLFFFITLNPRVE